MRKNIQYKRYFGLKSDNIILIKMKMCRTCLKTPAVKDISELGKRIKDLNKKCIDIMKFCLDITVTKNSKITTSLCTSCYRKIISIYKFKATSLKNDAYLKTLKPVVLREDKKLSVYVDEHRVKVEKLLETDECSGFFEDCDTTVKLEHVKTEYTLDVEIEIASEQSVEKLAESKDEKIVQVIKSDREPLHVVPEDSCENQNIKKKNTENAKNQINHKLVEKVQPHNVGNITKQRQICSECGSSVLDLRKHQITHLPKDQRRTVQCKACPKEFLSNALLNKHYKITHLGLKSKCDICNKEFVNVKNHQLYHHNKAGMAYKCATCQRRFICPSTLKMHMLTHTKEFAFECDICHKMFQTKSSISAHIREFHMREINYRCEFCAKAFYSNSCLQEHLGTHTTERAFKCSECGKSFTTKTRLKKHGYVHSDVRNFHCQFCNMTFKLNAGLQSHLLKHTKEKRFPCRFCDKRFSRSTHRLRHERSLHKELPTTG